MCDRAVSGTHTPGPAPPPRRRQEQRLAAHPVRRDQPAHPAPARPDPPRRSLDPGLTATGQHPGQHPGQSPAPRPGHPPRGRNMPVNARTPACRPASTG